MDSTNPQRVFRVLSTGTSSGVTNVTDNARLTLVKVRETPEELLTLVTTKNGVTSSVTQRKLAHSLVLTQAVTQHSSVITKLQLRYVKVKKGPEHLYAQSDSQ